MSITYGTVAIPAISKLSPRVVRVLGLNPGPMTLQGSNTYLVGTGGERLLIDTGEGRQGYSAVLKQAVDQAAEDLGQPVSVTKVLLTHWHPDHIGGVEQVRALYPKATLFKRKSAFNPVPVEEMCLPPPDTIVMEGASVRVLHTPGHTDDHLCAFLEEEQAIFTSDTILGEGTSVFSCYTDYMNTLELLKFLSPKVLYPAHGPVVTDGVKRIDDIIEHRLQREKQIMEALLKVATNPSGDGGEAAMNTSGTSIFDLVKAIYTDLPSNLVPAAGVNVFHHLKKLMNDGKVTVVHCPDALVDVLDNRSDYALLGEGVRTDKEIMAHVFADMRVAAVL